MLFAARCAWYYTESHELMVPGKILRAPVLILAALCFTRLHAGAAPSQPYFLYGASFFYERVPRDRWQASLEQYRALGINTIDLYVMWNWHQPVDAPPPVRQEGDTTVYSLVEEQLVLTKQLVLREELHVTRRDTERRDNRTVTLQRETIEVTRTS